MAGSELRQVNWRRYCVCVLASVIVLCAFSGLLIGGARGEMIELTTDMAPLVLPRAAAGTVMGDDGRIYVIGGYQYNFSSFDTTSNYVMIYNISSGVTSLGTGMSSGVAWPSCVKLDDGRIAVIGGYDSSVQNGTSAVRIYNPVANSWTTNTSAPVNISKAGTALGTDGRVYIFGPNNHQNRTLIYDPANDSWSYGADLPGGRSRYGSSAVTYNSTSIYVIGGSYFYYVFMFPNIWIPIFGDTNYVDIYNPMNNTWSTGPPLTANKEFGGAAVDRYGRICYFGGQSFWGTVYDDIEILDPSTQGASWQVSQYNMSREKAHFGITSGAHSSIFIVGGRVGSPTWMILPDVEMIMVADVSEVNEIAIISPSDQSNVSGQVELIAELRNQHLYDPVLVDFYVDNVRMETQLGGSATSWRFMWDSSGETNGSQHNLSVKCYFADNSVSEDTVTVTIGIDDDTTEGRLTAIEQRLTSIESEFGAMSAALANLSAELGLLSNDSANLSSAISGIDSQLQSLANDFAELASSLSNVSQELDDVNSSLVSELSGIVANIDALSSRLTSLETSVGSFGAELGTIQASINSLMDQVLTTLDDVARIIENNTESIDGIKDSTEKAETTSSSAELYAMIAVVVSVIVCALLVANILMVRRKGL